MWGRLACTLYLPRVDKDFSMNLNRIFKPISAILLTAGIVVAGVSAPADAATTKAPSHTTNDTGWGIK
jgi:hypothetical protein